MRSLLGQFYSRIKGSQEDIASEGLTYILQQSISARNAINKIVKSDFGLEFGNMSYSTQNAGDKLERPDISGYDNDGNEVLIMEAKFWAALTENQPVEYLNRLLPKGVLMFICPTLRVRPVFDELVKRINAVSLVHTIDYQSHAITIDETRHIIVKTWNEILGTIKNRLVQDNEQLLISDVDQIIGFCDTIDSNAFLPLQSDDLSPKHARRINSYNDIVDKVVNVLIGHKIVSTPNLKASSKKSGYIKYMKSNHLGMCFNISYEYWASYADTPFWISFKDPASVPWTMPKELIKACKTVASQLSYTFYEVKNREVFFALFPLLDKTEDLVIKDLAEQIIKLIDSLERQMGKTKNE